MCLRYKKSSQPFWPKLLDRGCFAGIPRKVGPGGCLEIALLHVLHFISINEEGEIVIILFHWAYSCNYTSQKPRKELRERQIEKVCTVHVWIDLESTSTSLKCFLMFSFWTEKTSNPFTYGDHDQWPLSATGNDFMGGDAEIRTGIMKHQNLRCFSRPCYWFSSCVRLAASLCLSYVRQRVHNYWSRYVNLLLSGMS